MIKKSLLLFALGVIAFTTNVSAQQSDEDAIKAVIQRRAELINMGKSHQYITQILQLHTREYQATNVVYFPDGRMSTMQRDLSAVKQLLSHYSDNADQQYALTMREVPLVQVFDRTALAIFVDEYVMKDANSGETLYGGEQIVTANFRKTPDGWKFNSQYVSEIRNVINVYPCYYELYQKDANELLAAVMLPAGGSFHQEFLDVRFMEVNPGTTLVRSGNGDEFSWEDNVLRSTITNSDSESIGRPNNKTAVVENLIMFYHNDVCADARLAK